jgi:hypothetical protein
MNWTEIEEQIADFREHYKMYPPASQEHKLVQTMQSLLEVAKAAERIKERVEEGRFSKCSLGRGEKSGWEHAWWELYEPMEALAELKESPE